VKGVQPNWLPAIRVADLNAMVARAVSLGGRVILAPRPDMRNGTIAIIGDPTGAALTLQQWDGTIAAGAR
jgi:predicted enzyme related to lactoylglutathione lyase